MAPAAISMLSKYAVQVLANPLTTEAFSKKPRMSTMTNEIPLTLPVQAENIPSDLTSRKTRWVNWRWVWDGKRHAKIPINPVNASQQYKSKAGRTSSENVLLAYENTAREDCAGIGIV